MNVNNRPVLQIGRFLLVACSGIAGGGLPEAMVVDCAS